MALRNVSLHAASKGTVATGVRIIRAVTDMRRRDNTRPTTGSNMTTFSGGRPALTGTYVPPPMPRPHLFIPYERNVRSKIV